MFRGSALVLSQQGRLRPFFFLPMAHLLSLEAIVSVPKVERPTPMRKGPALILRSGLCRMSNRNERREEHRLPRCARQGVDDG